MGPLSCGGTCFHLWIYSNRKERQKSQALLFKEMTLSKDFTPHSASSLWPMTSCKAPTLQRSLGNSVCKWDHNYKLRVGEIVGSKLFVNKLNICVRRELTRDKWVLKVLWLSGDKVGLESSFWLLRREAVFFGHTQSFPIIGFISLSCLDSK